MSMIMAEFYNVADLYRRFGWWNNIGERVGKKFNPLIAVFGENENKNIIVQPNILKCKRIINGRFM